MTVALVTCEILPEPDPDRAPLDAGLAGAGIDARWCAWSDDSVDWSGFDLVVLRSTWDYVEAHERFVAWAERVAAVASLWNPLPVVRWNLHKRYLLDLAERGIAVVPTHMVGDSDGDLASICDERGWCDVVVKPAVSCASFETHPMTRDGADEALFSRLRGEREMMVQPYVESVSGHGERAVVVVDGVITHSIRKQPRLSGETEGVTGPHPIDDDERALATAAVEAVGQQTLYARVDMARDADGTPMVMELELAEPSLFFPQSAEALDRFVAGILRRL